MEEKLLINVYEGRLGHEQKVATLDATDWEVIPSKGDLISFGCIETQDTDVWEVIQLMLDDSTETADEQPEHRIELFVKRYEWN